MTRWFKRTGNKQLHRDAGHPVSTRQTVKPDITSNVNKFLQLVFKHSTVVWNKNESYFYTLSKLLFVKYLKNIFLPLISII